MIEEQNGYIKLGDKWIDAKIEVHVDLPELEEQGCPFNLNESLRKMREPTTVTVDGTLTDLHLELFKELYQSAQSTPLFLISKEMYWSLQYLAQGKRYPSPRKRKSKARMSRKWRRYEQQTI